MLVTNAYSKYKNKYYNIPNTFIAISNNKNILMII